MEQADGSFIERARVHRDERKPGATNEFVATGDLSGEVTWYVEGNKVMVPKFGSTGTIQADGNITWDLEGTKAVYEGSAGEPSPGNQSIRDDVGKIALKSVHGKYLSAQPDGRAEWNRTIASDWEFFELGERDGRKITLRSTHGKYVSAQPDGTVQINRDHAPPTGWEEFTVETRPGSTPGDAHDFVHLKSVHGKYLSAQADGTVQWNRDHAPPGGWEDIQFVPQVTQNQEPAPTQNQEPTSTTREESIEILEAVTGKPVRFKINNRPSSNDAWVGIYPLMASDQDHGAQNQRWKWLRDIDVNNASLPKQSEGQWSIRVFSDGGHTLHERKDFTVKAEPRDPVAVQAIRKNAWIALVVGIIMFGIGLPLFIASGQVNLGMLIPGAILFGVGAFSAVSAWFVLITSWSESYAVTGKPAPRWTKVAVVFAVLLLIPGAALNIIGAISIGTLHHEETSSARLSITDTDGMGDQGFIIFIEAVPGDFDNNGKHDYCENVIVNATHSGLWMSEPWTSQAKQNDADQTRQVFELEIAHDGSGCDANVWPQQKGGLVKLGRACYGCMAGYTDISASRNDNSTPIPMWIQDGEKVGDASGLTIAGGIISGLSVLSLIGLRIFHSKIKANRIHARKDTSADSSYSIQLEDMSFWDGITEGSEDNRSYHDKLLEKMKYPDKEEIEQDIQSGKSLQKWYSHWLHDPVKSAEIAKALGLVVGGAGYDFEGSWGTKGLYAYRSGKYSGHAYFGTGGSDEDRLAPEDDDDKYRPWDRNDPKTPENIRKIWLEIEPRLARSYYLDPPNDD